MKTWEEIVENEKLWWKRLEGILDMLEFEAKKTLYLVEELHEIIEEFKNGTWN